MKKLLLLLAILLTIQFSGAQSMEDLQKEIEGLRQQLSNFQYSFQGLSKQIDDVQWYNKVGDVAFIDKVVLTGPPIGKDKAKLARGGNNPVFYSNPLRIQTYIFIPRSIDPSKKYPLLVFPHGGVHGDFGTGNAHMVRELLAQEYIVVAPEYRGSTGYGRGFYEAIDYGGLENQDVKACRDYMVDNYEIVDNKRIGILGWSHGGMITLMNLFEFPDAYQVGYAGVPVSDLIARMGYKTESYRDLFSADYHIGKTAYQDPDEYRRRSPAWNAHKLQTPLLIHTNTNDSDVNVLEVEHLIKALKAEGKKFEYEVYKDIPGGHTFDRIDLLFAKEVRLKIYRFLGGYLNPPKPFKSLKDLHKAGYGY